MKASVFLKSALTALVLAAVPQSRAALTESTNVPVNIIIPDSGGETGIGSTITFASSIYGIEPGATASGLTVSLDVAGGYNGDLYVTLEHGTNFVVLLNRAGRTSLNDAGYGDSGFNITFDDSALNGDVHFYRTHLNPLGGDLLGTWQPDGRDVDPDLSDETISRTTTLNSFLQSDPNGEWSLSVIDAVQPDRATLVSWGLKWTYTSPAEIAVFAGNSTTAPEITNHQAVAVDFGASALGLPVSRDLTLANTGNAPLKISAVNVPAGYKTFDLPALPFNLAAHGSLPFTVTLQATADGTASGNLEILSDDADEGSFRFPLTGIIDGTAPQIITCATNRTVVMSGSAPATPDLTAEVIATDNLPGIVTITQSPVAGTPLATGTNLVSITATDAAGNESYCETAIAVIRLPAAGADFGETLADIPVVFRTVKLLANDVDPDGARLQIVAISPASAQGGTVSLSGGNINYMPPSGYSGNDTFTYTLDAGGRQARGIITVRVRPQEGIPVNLVYLRPAANPDTGYIMRFSGLPGRSYSIQFTASLAAGWTEIARVTAQANTGFVDHHDPSAPSDIGFYRCIPAQ
jgi:subtilisin-like proprotein convertase family protein